MNITRLLQLIGHTASPLYWYAVSLDDWHALLALLPRRADYLGIKVTDRRNVVVGVQAVSTGRLASFGPDAVDAAVAIARLATWLRLRRRHEIDISPGAWARALERASA